MTPHPGDVRASDRAAAGLFLDEADEALDREAEEIRAVVVADDQFGLAGGATPQAQGQGFVDAGALGDPGQYFPVLSFAVTPFRTVRYDRDCLLVRPCEPVLCGAAKFCVFVRQF